MAPIRVAIVGGNRIPFARSGSAYATASNQDLLTAAIDGLVARFGLAGERLGEGAAGAVLKHSRDFNLTRESVLGSRLDARTPAYDVQQACGTGLETVILVANKIPPRQIEAGRPRGGFCPDLAGPSLGLARDQNLGPDGPVEKLAKLKPVSGGGPEGRRPAGTPTPLTDGAAVVLLAPQAWAKGPGLPILAYFDTAET